MVLVRGERGEAVGVVCAGGFIEVGVATVVNDAGHFADVTEAAGLLVNAGAVRQAVWVDVDADVRLARSAAGGVGEGGAEASPPRGISFWLTRIPGLAILEA